MPGVVLEVRLQRARVPFGCHDVDDGFKRTVNISEESASLRRKLGRLVNGAECVVTRNKCFPLESRHVGLIKIESV